jgi:hypothetical protein
VGVQRNRLALDLRQRLQGFGEAQHQGVRASFSPQATFATGMRPRWVAVGDFNGDGGLDLAVANLLSGTASVLLESGTTTITRPQATGTILEDDAPVTITVVAGSTPQNAVVNTEPADTRDLGVRIASTVSVGPVDVPAPCPGHKLFGPFFPRLASSNGLPPEANFPDRHPLMKLAVPVGQVESAVSYSDDRPGDGAIADEVTLSGFPRQFFDATILMIFLTVYFRAVAGSSVFRSHFVVTSFHSSPKWVRTTIPPFLGYLTTCT